ncbi:MAG: tripartite tricarboxylate transporter permease [Spirochaetota bacterium]|nr:tripartite tricarboxylate transporter permease [Spirochaetota bacterium]
MIEHILAGFLSAFHPVTIGMLIAGLVLGGFFGALPGLTTTMAMAILVPFTFFMPTMVGIPFLLGIYKGGMWGGSIPAILLNVPGTGASVATLYDGYPLSLKGFAKKALLVALIASAGSEFLADIFVLFVMAPLSKLALMFGAADFFSLILASLIVMSTVSKGSPIKGFISMGIGLFLATIGTDPAFGIGRFNFGSLYLRNGISFVPLVIGVFAFSEVLASVANRKNESLTAPTAKGKGPGLTGKELKSIIVPSLKGTVVGTIVGMIPALNQPIAAFLGYSIEKRTGRNKEMMGQGALEGVAAPEAANNAVNGGALVPLLTFGIPGDVVTAILLGAFVVQGLRPGPRLMVDNPEMMYAILTTLVVGNIVLLFVGRLLIEPFSRIVMIPKNILLPILIVMCFVGSFAINYSMFDVFIGLAFGVIGFLMKRYGYSVSTMAIAFLLGFKLETYMVQALSISQGDWSTFVTRPISLTLLIIVVAIIGYGVFTSIRKKQKREVFA